MVGTPWHYGTDRYAADDAADADGNGVCRCIHCGAVVALCPAEQWVDGVWRANEVAQYLDGRRRDIMSSVTASLVDGEWVARHVPQGEIIPLDVFESIGGHYARDMESRYNVVSWLGWYMRDRRFRADLLAQWEQAISDVGTHNRYASCGNQRRSPKMPEYLRESGCR